jgi:hypothetical protein
MGTSCGSITKKVTWDGRKEPLHATYSWAAGSALCLAAHLLLPLRFLLSLVIANYDARVAARIRGISGAGTSREAARIRTALRALRSAACCSSCFLVVRVIIIPRPLLLRLVIGAHYNHTCGLLSFANEASGRSIDRCRTAASVP